MWVNPVYTGRTNVNLQKGAILFEKKPSRSRFPNPGTADQYHDLLGNGLHNRRWVVGR